MSDGPAGNAQRGTWRQGLALLGRYLSVAVMNETQYRANFFVQLFQSLIALGTGVAALLLVFSYTDSLRGWGPSDLVVVLGVHVMMGALIRATIQPNMQRIMGDVEQGTLDYVLTKPVDSQLLVSIRAFQLWQLVDLVVGAVVVGVGLAGLGARVGVLDAAAFGAAMLLGASMIYSLWLILTTGAFWFIRMGNLFELFNSFYQAGRWPVGLYPGWLRFGLTFLVPVAFAVTVPAEALTGRLTAGTLAAATALAAGMLWLARRLWFWGLTRYTGASA